MSWRNRESSKRSLDCGGNGKTGSEAMTCRKPLLLLAWLLSGPALASHPDELLWGDTHVHSRNSQDGDFDPTRPAFYYARVIEVSSPRWTAYEADRYELTLPAEIPTSTRERAYGSPIWIRPQ